MNKFASKIGKTLLFAAFGLWAWAYGFGELVENGRHGIFAGFFGLVTSVVCFGIAFRRD